MLTVLSSRSDLSLRARLRRWACALLVPVCALAMLGTAQAREDDDEDIYSIGLWGDLPYSPAQATVGLPNLIADMNAQRLKFSVHDGDLKAGSGSPCNDALYTQSLAYFNALHAPAMFTPGDNDWTDCDRASNGSYNSRERLDKERAVFFSTPYSMGQRRMLQEVQQGNLCLGVSGLVQCVENRRWTVGRVTYVTLNIPGSVAVMLIAQANPGWDLSDPTRARLRDPKTLVQTDGQPT